MTTVFLRAFSVAVLGALLGITGGFVVSLTKKPQYTAVALIQVSTPDPMNSSGDFIDRSLCSSDRTRFEGNVIQDTLIIRSRAALEEAIDIGRLGSMSGLKDKSTAE